MADRCASLIMAIAAKAMHDEAFLDEYISDPRSALEKYGFHLSDEQVKGLESFEWDRVKALVGKEAVACTVVVIIIITTASPK